MGRLTGFVGPESCGKTLMANKIMANAQKKGMYVAYFDTEGALDEATAKRLGCDTSKIKHVPSEITEQCRNEIVQFLGSIVANNLQGQVLLVIDSLGNLITTQEKKKIDEGTDTVDMGNRARQLKSLMRAVTHAAAKANCPIIFTNHIYDDPSQLHPSAIKKQAGGSGPLYMASVTVQMAKKTEKAEDSKNKDSNSETTILSKGINGLTLRALTTKNRFVTPFLEIEMYLNFRTGLNKYSGLLEMAEGYGVIEKQGHRYAFKGESLGFFKDWKDNESVWKKIMPALEAKLQTELCFKNESNESFLTDLDNDIDDELKQ
jgi:recombination protein RecA